MSGQQFCLITVSIRHALMVTYPWIDFYFQLCHRLSGDPMTLKGLQVLVGACPYFRVDPDIGWITLDVILYHVNWWMASDWFWFTLLTIRTHKCESVSWELFNLGSCWWLWLLMSKYVVDDLTEYLTSWVFSCTLLAKKHETNLN